LIWDLAKQLFRGFLVGCGLIILLTTLLFAICIWAYYIDDKGNSTQDGTKRPKSDPPPTKAVPPAGWVEFNQTGTGFKAFFPVKPKETNLAVMKLYEGEDKTIDCSCSVITEVTGTIVPEKRKEFGEELAKLIFDSLGAKILSRKDGTLAGFNGTELLIAEPDYSSLQKGPPSKTKTEQKTKGKGAGRGVFRVIITENTLIIAGVASDSGVPNNEWVTAFFDNFELVK
jgi:hypothetical protein